MLGELESQRLTVRKVPSKRRDAAGRPTAWVRVVEQTNPEWYQKFCEGYVSNRKDKNFWRKHKTGVKRSLTIIALRHLSKGTMGPRPFANYQGPLYVERLLPVIKKWIADGRKRRKAEKAARAERRAEILAGVPF